MDGSKTRIATTHASSSPQNAYETGALTEAGDGVDRELLARSRKRNGDRGGKMSSERGTHPATDSRGVLRRACRCRLRCAVGRECSTRRSVEGSMRWDGAGRLVSYPAVFLCLVNVSRGSTGLHGIGIECRVLILSWGTPSCFVQNL